MAIVVPLVDVKAQYREIQDEIDLAIRRVLASGEFILGAEVEQFEREFAEYCDVRHAVGVASGTDALTLTLMGLGVGPGQMVVTTPFTFVSTADAVVKTGAAVEFVDIEPRTCNLDANRLQEFLETRGRETREGLVDAMTGARIAAVLPVHLYGQPADMTAIGEIAQRYRLQIIEDAAQAHGARHAGRRVGTFGRAATFSFYPSKNLGAYGDAGAVVTNDGELATRLRSLRVQGRRGRHEHLDQGLNSRLDEIQAAILRVKLSRLDAWNNARRRAAARYDDLLAGAARARGVRGPSVLAENESVYHLYVVRTHARDQLGTTLGRQGIGTGVHYPIPVPLQPSYRHLGVLKGAFPESEAAAREVLSIPLFPEIATETQEAVVQAITEWAPEAAIDSWRA